MRHGRIVLLVVVVLTVAGCGPGEDSPVPSTGAPAPDPNTAFSELAAQQLESLEGGASAPPALLDWASIQQGATLDVPHATAFCTSLNAPGVDNGLASIIAIAIDAVSMRLRHRPAPDELDAVLGIATTFAAKTCPAWAPGAPAPTHPPPVGWYPSGYQAVILHPDLAWRWSPTGSFTCTDPDTWCFELQVVTRDGCDSLHASITTKDATGLPLEILETSTFNVPPGVETPLGFATDQQPEAATLSVITCEN